MKEKGFGLVRRQTGGRGVLHDKELTYSVIVPESHPNMLLQLLKPTVSFQKDF